MCDKTYSVHFCECFTCLISSNRAVYYTVTSITKILTGYKPGLLKKKVLLKGT